MPLDAICLSALANELKETVLGSRIDKIHQPARDEVILSLRGSGGGMRLLLSASPTRPRAQLTELSRENPQEPPMFCMLLRKHLTGGRILDIAQPQFERLLEFHIEVPDELGDRSIRRLILEVMGRRANLLLLDREGRIMDCLRKVDADMSQERQLLPGMFYRLPPTQDKESPFSVLQSPPSFVNAWGQRIEKLLVETFAGISPLIARELAFEAAGSTEALLSEENCPRLQERLVRLMTKVEAKELAPYLLVRDGIPVDFSFRPILQYGPSTESRRMESFSKLLDGFYAEREGAERIRQKGQDLLRSLNTARDRLSRKLIIQEKELEGTKDREQLRQMGDLITANLYRMEKGITQLKTENYYDPECNEITIKLDPLKTPQQNAARYYKDYHRAKTAERVLTEQLATGRRELEYLNSVLESASRAEGERDLEEIRQELVETGYVRRRGKAKDRMKRVSSKPLEFRSSSGLRISVGRNNSQNDALTTKLAGKGDLWFHVQKIHGAHVILWTDGQSPDLQSMTEAAMLAAWFSQGRSAGKVPVDYTLVKHVKKPAGARPGMVVYTTYETAYVTPEEACLKTLSV